MNYFKINITKPYKSVYHCLKDMGYSEHFLTNLRKVWGNIILNNKEVNIRAQLQAGDELKINNNPSNKTQIKECILPLDIVFEDEYYLLVFKPANLATTPTQSNYDNNLSGAVLNYMKQKDDNFTIRIANRLDKDTSGIVIFAKNAIALKALTAVEKTYHAICEGKIDTKTVVNKKIKTVKTENGINQLKRIISSDGKEATTFITPIKHLPKQDLTLIELKLEHGRTHQIRVHLSSINHPLLGDIIYGNKSENINHSALLCKKISFFHPFIHKQLEFEVDYPKDFQKIIKIF